MKQDRQLRILAKTQDPWNSYSGYVGHSLTPQETNFTYSFIMAGETDNAARFAIDLGTSNTNFSISYFAIDKINLQTSLNERSFDEIKIFPNPITNRVNIENNARFNFASIYDGSGRLIKNLTLNTSSHSIDTENLNAGLYILRLSGDQDARSIKLIKH
jgi:hypothetical protein